MNTGKTLFAQLMDFLPWSTFDRIVARYDGNRAVRTRSCAAQNRRWLLPNSSIGRAYVTSRLACRRSPPSCTIWDFANRFADPPWRMPTKRATGAFSFDQRGGEDVHPVGSTWQHSKLYSRLRRQTSRCQRAGFAADRSGFDLCRGSWICRFRPAVWAASGGGFLRHPREVQHEGPQALFGTGGSSRSTGHRTTP